MKIKRLHRFFAAIIAGMLLGAALSVRANGEDPQIPDFTVSVGQESSFLSALKTKILGCACLISVPFVYAAYKTVSNYLVLRSISKKLDAPNKPTLEQLQQFQVQVEDIADHFYRNFGATTINHISFPPIQAGDTRENFVAEVCTNVEQQLKQSTFAYFPLLPNFREALTVLAKLKWEMNFSSRNSLSRLIC